MSDPIPVLGAPAPAINGGQGLLALWLLVSTNPNLLLVPARTAVNADIASHTAIGTTPPTLTPSPDDKIQTWDQLAAAVTTKLEEGVNNPDYGNFTVSDLQYFVTATLYGNSIQNTDGSVGPTYAQALFNACYVFQAISKTFATAWGLACPKTMGEALDM